MTAKARDRAAARTWGIRAERLAEIALRLKLFRILARNYRVRDGEIDLIAQRGALIVFVEVKARASLLEGMDAVSGRKRHRMTRAARHWRATHPRFVANNFRADGMFVQPGRWPHHVPDLFPLDLG